MDNSLTIWGIIDMAMTVEEILKKGKELGASDVHLTVGIPPKMRINGKLVDRKSVV